MHPSQTPARARLTAAKRGTSRPLLTSQEGIAGVVRTLELPLSWEPRCLVGQGSEELFQGPRARPRLKRVSIFS